MQLLAFINFAAAVQGIFLGFVLLRQRGHLIESRILALLVFVLSFSVLGSFLGLSGLYRQLPHLIRIGDPLIFLVGPLLFFYITIITRGRLPKWYGLHLLPFLMYLIILIPFYSMSGDEKIAFTRNYFLSSQLNDTVIFIQVARIIHVSVYVILCLYQLRYFNRVLKVNFSSINKFNLDRSATILKIFITGAIVTIIAFIGFFFKHMNFVVMNSYVSLGVSILIYAVAYTSWKYAPPAIVGKMVPPAKIEDEEISNKEETPAKTKNLLRRRSTYNLSDERVEILSCRLQNLLEEQKVFLNNEYSLAQLSEQLEIEPYQASELINRKHNESFFDLVNRHRIEEVKRRLFDKEHSHLSILGVSIDCGFNSKSSFNTAFKKFTGQTPSEYRNSVSKPVKDAGVMEE